MNRFASFNFGQSTELNALIEKYPLAAGTNVFSSEGKLIVQYQDGLEEPAVVKAIRIKEQVRAFHANKEELIHSNKVLETLIADARSRVEIAEAEVSRLQTLIDEQTSSRGKKLLRDELELADKTVKERRQALHEVSSQKTMNEHEIARLDLNVELFEEQVTALMK